MSVVITYETLFDLLRKEKSREDLQILPETFYADVEIYLKKKQGELASSANSFRANIEFENIKKIMKELYERRERKILLLSLNKARTASTIIDPSVLLPEEKPLFDSLVDILTNQKDKLLFNLINLRGITVPTAVSSSTSSPDSRPAEDSPAQTKDLNMTSSPENTSDSASLHSNPDQNTESLSASVEPVVVNGMIKVKFLVAIPKFLGKDMKVFGPYSVGSEAELPEQIATILIKKGRAESAGLSD